MKTLEIPPHPENLVEMGGGNEPVAVKHLQHDGGKECFNDKWRKRKGIKRNLCDLPRQSYQECENYKDQLDQSKKYKIELLAGLNSDVGELPEERENQPISELALQDGRVQHISATQAAPIPLVKREQRGSRGMPTVNREVQAVRRRQVSRQTNQ